MDHFQPVSKRVHGGPDALGVPLHDFSTNSNACGPCPVALAAVRDADAGNYPDAAYTLLRQQLASFHGVEARRLVLAASASEFIFRVSALAGLRGASVWLPPHAYGDYAQAASACRLAVVKDAPAAQLRWACEPSSPLGTAQAGLPDMLLPTCPDAITVLDRAYEPLRLSGSPSLNAAQLDRVWQLWTPNKALGLTGVRAAYAIAPLHFDDDVQAMDALCPSWPVGAHGVAMLQAWTLPDVQAWLAGSVGTLREWKTRQLDVCGALGWTCLESDANFFVCHAGPHSDCDPAAFVTALRHHGIKLRDCASFGLPGHVRVSVQPPLAQNALQQAWHHLNGKT